jgi:hypothetical protein
MRRIVPFVVIVLCLPLIANAQRVRRYSDPELGEIVIDFGDDPALKKPSKPAKAAKKAAAAKAVAAPGKVIEDADAKVRAWLKDNVNDPSRLSIVSATKPFSLDGWRQWAGDVGDRDLKSYNTVLWVPMKPGLTGIAIKYRTANGLGALILRSDVFILDGRGEVTGAISAEDIRSPQRSAAAPTEDPFTKAFMDAFK